MYTISKVPSPRGYKTIEKEIPVNQIHGLSNIHKEDGVLVGEIHETVRNTPMYFIVTHIMHLSDGTDKEFSHTQILYDDNKIKLGVSPFFTGNSRKIESIDIVVESVS